jgi:internalin A
VNESIPKESHEFEERIAEEQQSHTGRLDLSELKLEEIPPLVFSMPWLRSLNLEANNLSRVPDDIALLRNLEELDLWRGKTRISISEHIGDLSELRNLSVGPGSPDLPSSIGRCKKLSRLAIGNNRLRTLPDWLARLSDLEVLQVWSNELEALPDMWADLPRLRVLNLHNNHLHRLPPSFGALHRLERLDLGKNRFSNFPDILTDLQNLRTIILGGNQFHSIPETVSNWRNLEALDLNSDPSMEVFIDDENDVDLMRRRSKDEPVRESELKVLPTGLRELPALRVLVLHGNPRLGLPDELLGGGHGSEYTLEPWAGNVGDILDYYFRTRGGARPLNEAKLLLLGWGGVGKTSLVNRLVRGRFDPGELRTEGIEVISWPVELDSGEQVRLNVWDFGGQEIMHATHQFFLTSRSLYLLVLNGRAGSADADIEYWMRIVSSFAAGSPVVVAMNQIEKDPFELDETGLRAKYPEIRAFVRTDCAVGEKGLGIEELRRAILEQTDRLPDLRISFPAAWFQIKDRLASMDENYLTFERYRQLCTELGEDEGQAQEQLANYLHSLGIALNYRDDPRLRDTHVLNPHWVTEGIYAILNSRLVAEQGGEVTAQDLPRVLDRERYPPERYGFILELMRKFELCFAYPEDPDRYLVADLLPKQQPDAVTDLILSGALWFEYRYPLLPEGLLPRFIVRSHVHSTDQPRWRSGVVLRWEQNHALVRADAASGTVSMAVTGSVEGRRRLLAVIRSDFEHIHRTYRFKVPAFVPVREGLSVEYDKLVAAERSGMSTFPEFVAGEFVQISVAELLNGVDLDRPQRRHGAARLPGDGPRPVKLFITYSHRDEVHREVLGSHLKVLQSVGLLDVWHDRRIDPGDDWKGEIDQAIEDADVVVALVSADFLASDYCNDVELPRALERHAAGLCRVVPVIVRDAQWNLTRLGALQALPKDGKPVTTWANRDSGWRDVGEGLERVIRDVQATRRGRASP